MSNITTDFVIGVICGVVLGWDILLLIALIVEAVRVWRSF